MWDSNSKPTVNGRNDEMGRGERLVGNGFALRAEEEEEVLDDNFAAMRNMVEFGSKRLEKCEVSEYCVNEEKEGFRVFRFGA